MLSRKKGKPNKELTSMWYNFKKGGVGMRLLVVEDERDLMEAIADGLRLDGYAVDTCANGIDAYEAISVETYDLIILDLNLPGMDGLELLKKIQEESFDSKVLILSARNRVEDKVKGLDYGAHDYLVKPFDFAELEARIRNLLRRKFAQAQNNQCYLGIHIDFAKRTVCIKDSDLILTRKEFAILEYLILHKEKVVSAEELIEHVWDSNADAFSGAIRVHISALRRKLKIVLNYDPIETRIGVGYQLREKSGEEDV